MKFIPIDRRACPFGASCLTRFAWLSAGGLWVITVDRVLYGYRVHLSHRDDHWSYLTDYCAGGSDEWCDSIVGVIMQRLDPLDEQIAPGALQWPPQITKPMANDAACWSQLCLLATAAANAGGDAARSTA